MPRSLLLGALLSLVLPACHAGERAQAPTKDSGVEADADPIAIDTGTETFEDASLADAGAETPDAGFEDVAQNDSGSDAGAASPDANAPDASAPDANVADATPPDSGPVDPGPQVLNPGWIGGPCTSSSDCMFSGASCLPNAGGWPGGTCTQSCDRTCPDQTGPLNSVTFCIDDGNGDALGTCVSRCDFTLSPTGCRAGYVCLPEKRMNQPSVVRHVCVPQTGVPGRPQPAFDIGAACTSASSCNRAACITDLPGGYCTQEACDIVGCPAGSSCWNLGGQEQYFACLRDCAQPSECRTAQGYTCDSDQTCWWTPPPGGVCNLAPGPNDCAAYAAQASRDFVVVTKHQRRMTLCNGATAVQSWCIGLGSSPVLDKEREGDRRTPEGIFYVPRKLPNSQYYKAFLLSYPDTADAQRGLSQGIITQAEYNAIVAAQNARTEPPQNTNLGGLIEIHGNGGSSDWTWGCIAGDDSAIDVLWPVIDVGETIVVLP